MYVLLLTLILWLDWLRRGKSTIISEPKRFLYVIRGTVEKTLYSTSGTWMRLAHVLFYARDIYL